MRVERRDWDDAAAVALRDAQRAEIAERYGTWESEPGVAPSATDITVFLVAETADGESVGCGGLRYLGDGEAEIKRMYVRPEHRGTGVSVAVLAGLEEHGRRLGLRRLTLETGDRQPDAQRFYEREGYSRIPNFGPYEGVAESLCYAKELSA
jgi:GNAT superfamily N-acetyltransferase